MNSARGTSTLSVLLDVEMPLTLRFGIARMQLSDVLGLEPESVVELDRPTSEPVDVLVNGRLAARGYVVEVEGNYGVRIAEVVSQRERLNTTAGAL